MREDIRLLMDNKAIVMDPGNEPCYLMNIRIRNLDLWYTLLCNSKFKHVNSLSSNKKSGVWIGNFTRAIESLYKCMQVFS